MFRFASRVASRVFRTSSAAYLSVNRNAHGTSRIFRASALVLGTSLVLSFVNHRTATAESQSSSSQPTFLTRNFVADAAAIAAPSVVNISSTTNGVGGLVQYGSAGSGFIISKDGFIATNAHVVPAVAGSDVVVTLNDSRKFPGKVHSYDKMSDIAVVKISVPGEELPVALLGSSSDLRPGEFVIALGSPLQLQNSVSFGIVSATARHGSEIGAQQRYCFHELMKMLLILNKDQIIFRQMLRLMSETRGVRF
jgi:S1-C subfamily serine protease